MSSNDTNSYRDSIGTVDQSGKRRWIYPSKPSGAFHRARIAFSAGLLLFLFGAPFISIDGHPLILMNIFERKFIVFGIIFWPQDFYIFVLAIITCFIGIILFTSIFGRLWCGWACPQTVFMEMVYRKIDFWIEGDGNAQRRLNNGPWTGSKVFKKCIKHVLFFGIAWLIGNTLLAYIVGVDELKNIVTSPPSENMSGFVAMVVFAFIFYGIFSWFREQACLMVCPYGRLQSVLLDPDSVVVAYDYKRGEPRGKVSAKDQSLGDCINCNKCVTVCPTGIDIRNGTQMECVNCTACIDACDDIMDKVERPRGLIRYASHNSISEGGKVNWFKWRTAGYGAVFSILCIIVTSLLLGRTDVEATLLRAPGSTYATQPDGTVSNIYNLKLTNKTFNPQSLHLTITSHPANVASIQMVEPTIALPPHGFKAVSFLIKFAPDRINRRVMPISVGLFSGERLVSEKDSKFLGPYSAKKE